jgi:hypothetical protein
MTADLGVTVTAENSRESGRARGHITLLKSSGLALQKL